LKKILFKILSFFTLFIPTKFLIKLSGKRIIYPFYHIISDNPPAHIKYLYPVRSIKQFEKDLVFLQKHFTVSDFPVKGNNPQFVLSFDDGLSEVYDIIAPILKKRNIPAIFFVNTPGDYHRLFKTLIFYQVIRKRISCASVNIL